MNYYNDNDTKACAWLRELIAQGHLPPGDVDCRSILEVKPDEIRHYDQCHFFAGIGGWPLALRWAGLENARGIWTGSCPCQPLSCAGKRQGHADERHLWPAFHGLIAECRPATVFGEQVASADGREWLAGVRLDLEDLGYACGGADLCAAGVGAPHRRQRLYWVADSNGGDQGDGNIQRGWEHGQRQEDGGTVRLADGESERRDGTAGMRRQDWRAVVEAGGGMGNAEVRGRQGRSLRPDGEPQERTAKADAERPGWAGCVTIQCRDGKARRVPAEPALFPLADGIPGRVGLLRGAGNAIVPETAEAFVRAWIDSQNATGERPETRSEDA